ncbi:MAG TPA: hypothetical protein VHY32_01700 [Caulobacteraceae bacterium]|nr:hypothetical protein [Caulobacteraceae bacterium]
MMLRKAFSFVILAAAWLYAGSAWASGDFGCSTSWTLLHGDLDPCNNQPFLNPGNDSRVNLQLLLLDAGLAKLQPPAPPKDADSAPQPELGGAPSYATEDFTGFFNPPAGPDGAAGGTDFADGEGSRCRSNTGGSDSFQAALKDSRALPAEERAALAAARGALNPNCDDPSKAVAPAPTIPIKSGPGRQFATYLTGVTAFYGGDYDLARKSFESLRGGNQPWVKETARYMLGRVELNLAQKDSLDQYGDLKLDKIDAAAIAAAGTDFQAYLHDYPTGAYSASARGLLRRVAWLGGEPPKLAAELAWQFAHANGADRNVTEVQLVQEADSKLLTGADPTQIKEPLLLASLDLMLIRKQAGLGASKPIALSDLEAQRPVFAGREALFDYLLAAHAFYDDEDPMGALKRLPSSLPAGPMTYLDFSRQVLRGLALEAAKDPAAARALWLQLIPAAQPPQRPSLELALAMNYERGDRLALVFAPDSPIHNPDMRDILLRNGASAGLLRQRARQAGGDTAEQRVAAFVLLYKELTRGHYQDFLSDLASAPPAAAAKNAATASTAEADLTWFAWPGSPASDDGIDCPPLREVARTLARDPHQAHGQVCLTEFVRLDVPEDFDLDGTRPAGELGSAPSQFPGDGFSRLDLYKQLLTDPKTPPTERAYTLYRAVNCYAPSGNNHCGGKDVAPAQRKQWFRTLKTQYVTTPWGAALKYYW